MIDIALFNERINRVREYMKRKDYDYYVVFSADPHLSEYISDVDRFREYLSFFTGSAGTFIVSMDNAYLFVDGRYHIQASFETKGLPITIFKVGLENVKNPKEFLVECSEQVTGITIGLDGKYVSALFLNNLKKSLSSSAKIDICGFIDDIWPDRPKRVFGHIRNVDIKYSGCDTLDKLNSIREGIKSSHKDISSDYCFVISNLCSIMWVLNIRGNDIDYVPVAFSYLIVRQDEAIVYLNMESISLECHDYFNKNSVTVKSYSEFYDDLKSYEDADVLIDSRLNNALIWESFSKGINCDEAALVRKDIKNEVEMSCFRAFHINDAVSMIRFIKCLKEKVQKEVVSEYDAALLMDEIRLSDKECFSLSFETISAYGKNAALPHYSAQKDNCDILAPKGFYLVDCGGHYPSCTTDITRTIALGELTDKEKKMYTLVLKGNLGLMNAVFKKGTRGENLDILARLPLYREGLDFMHGSGHGIGSALSVHEGPLAIRPSISKEYLQPPLCKGMVVSDEPGIYIEKEMGIRLENELMVVEKFENELGSFLGFESLTYVPFERNAIDKSLLDENEIMILNNYHKLVYEKVSPLLDESERTWLYENTRAI